jgi:oxygen-dependent protoporphyrinogen oxidase
MKRVVVVGGGIAGLSTALHLQDESAEVPGGLEVLVLESSRWAGGNIQTERLEGYTIEKGPNGFLDNAPRTWALVERLGLQDQVQRADPSAAKRFLFRGGKLHLLPSGPLGLLTSPVLSLPGRLRVFGEPFARGRPADRDETIYEFGSRRIGQEATRVLIDAMVSGVFAGNIHELSLAGAFPRMAQMEEEHGSLVKAMLARMRQRRVARKEADARRARGEAVDELTRPGGPAGPGGTLTSFRSGLDTLPRAIAGELGEAVRFGAEVGRIVPGDQRWTVHTHQADQVSADAVVVAVPAPRAVPLLAGLDPDLADPVEGILTAGLVVVALALDAAEMGGAPEGFGFLVPRGEGPRILGCLWDSSIFPGRAPERKVLLRAMVGGAHDPGAVGAEEEGLVSRVREDLRQTMELTAEPLFTRIYRWPLGIGQYTVGHADRLDRLHAAQERHPGLWVAGSSFYGISMNACIEKAREQASEILAYLSC